MPLNLSVSVVVVFMSCSHGPHNISVIYYIVHVNGYDIEKLIFNVNVLCMSKFSL